ncbi:sulfurtransferase [Nonomuraea endophytica]|uniref:sulfurtransferase n=1 Tax=Nonomuraea endophytica TaxID=714136 RepID=UPI0037C7EA13
MSPLITPAEVAELGDAVTLLDVRGGISGPSGIDRYREGHLPGALFCDLDADLAAAPGAGGRHPLPSAEHFQNAMRRLGVTRGKTVVVYDDAGSTIAARAWWCLRYFGHDQVKVLDGGLPAWDALGLPIVKDEPTATPGDFTAVPGGMAVLTADEAASLASTGVLLDARSAERYRGEVEPIDPVAGHIPGAVSAPTTDNVTVDGRFLAASDLDARFTALGVTDGTPVGAYCGSGVTAAHEVLALNLAGYPAALYVGSWSNWVANPTHPIATA